MGQIRIGDVTVHDVNHNDQYDVVSDPVLDPFGQPLGGAALKAKMDGILKTIQAKSWQSLYLPDVAFLFDSLREAEQAASRGEPEEVYEALQDAKDAAKSLKLPLNRGRVDQLYQNALNLAIARNMSEADQVAIASGEIQDVKEFLNQAEEYVSEYNVNFSNPIYFDQKKADRILKTAYKNGIAASFPLADQAAYRGNFIQAEAIMEEAKIHVQEANSLFQLGLNFDQLRADQIVKEAYAVGLPIFWQKTEDLAKKGQIAGVRKNLADLSRAINRVTQNYRLILSYDTQRADQVLETAYDEAIHSSFDSAILAAQKGESVKVKSYLKKAEDLVNEYNQNVASPLGLPTLSFDQQKADQVRDCALGKQDCPN